MHEVIYSLILNTAFLDVGDVGALACTTTIAARQCEPLLKEWRRVFVQYGEVLRTLAKLLPLMERSVGSLYCLTTEEIQPPLYTAKFWGALVDNTSPRKLALLYAVLLSAFSCYAQRVENSTHSWVCVADNRTLLPLRLPTQDGVVHFWRRPHEVLVYVAYNMFTYETQVSVNDVDAGSRVDANFLAALLRETRLYGSSLKHALRLHS